MNAAQLLGNDIPSPPATVIGVGPAFRDERYLHPDKLNRLLRKHLQGALVRSGASFFMWLFMLVAYVAGRIGDDPVQRRDMDPAGGLQSAGDIPAEG